MKTEEKKFKSLVGMLEVFKDEQDCINHLTKIRWGEDICCPFCGVTKPCKFKDNKTYKCSDKECRRKFNVKTGSIFENTKIPLRKWFIAIYLHSAHKKGVSSIQIAKDIGVTQKTGWFMLHRIREMMKEVNPVPFSGTVEVDETFVGGKNKFRHKDKKIDYKKVKGRSFPDKTPVMGILNKETKKIRTFVIPSTKEVHTIPLIYQNVYANSILYTDDWGAYKKMGRYYHHTSVDHGKGQWMNGEATTNTIEGAWSHLKRTIIGIYHQVSPKHLQSYCNEFAFRYNSKDMDGGERFNLALIQCEGRLKYNDLKN